MGYTEAAARQVRIVPVASARMRCDIHCRLTTAHLAIEARRGAGPSCDRRPAAACALPGRGRGPAAPGDRVRGAGRSLEHPGLRRPVQPLPVAGEQRPRPPRRRADRRWWARSSPSTCRSRRRRPPPATRRWSSRLRSAWRPWPPGGTSSPPPRSARSRASPAARRCESAEHVAAALRAWHEAGTAAGDLAFWREPRRAVPLAQGLRPGGRRPAGAARPGGRHGPAGPVAQPGRARSRWSRRTTRSTTWRCAGWRSCGSDERRAAAGRRRRRPSAGRWPASSSTTSRPTPSEYWEVPRFELAGAAGRGRRGRRTTRTTTMGRPVRRRLRRRDLPRQHRRRLRGRDARRRPGGEDATDFELVAGGRADRRPADVPRPRWPELWKLAAVALAGRRRAGGRGPRRGARRLARPGRRPTAGGCWNCSPRSTATAFRRPAARTSRWSSTTAAAASRKCCWSRSSPPAWRPATPRGCIRAAMDQHAPGRRGWTTGRSRPSGRCARVLRGDAAAVRAAWRDADRGAWRSSRCSTWPWPAAATRSGSSPRAASKACSAACWPTCRGWACSRETGQLIADHPGDGGEPPGRARRDHRVRPDVRDRLQGDRPLPGRLGRRAGRAGRRRAPAAATAS